MKYYPRFADKSLLDRLKSSGAVLVEGAKGCGKTETATQLADSIVHFDADEQIRIMMEIDPKRVLQGDVPRLLDEWQEYPQIWNYVRREIDERKQKGQFILAGSSTPNDNVHRHSGAGRFSVVRMRPMSLFEKGWSTGEVRLHDLLHNKNVFSEPVEFELGDLAEKITLGGWPALINEASSEGFRYVSDYVSLISEVDLSRVSNKKRNPIKVIRLFQSIARNISTEATLTSLSRDIEGDTNNLDNETLTDYLDALERLMIIEDLPAWSTHIRSADTLRKSPKRHFVDPSLAVGALGLSVDKLLSDLNYFGLLFESLVIRDLRIYAGSNNGKVFHYRDSRGREVDAIIEYPDTSWSAFEVKLGIGAVDEAAKGLIKFVENIDTTKVNPPTSLNIITGNGFAYQRTDGVNVIPISTLTA